MDAELPRFGHPMLATLLTASLSGLAQAESPLSGAPADTDSTPRIAALDLIKEEETVSIASRYEQPISQAPSNVYVITDEDIRQSGATDLPTILRRIPGIEVMHMSGADMNVSARGNNQPFANKMLVMVDGRSIYLDVQGIVFWKAIPVTLPEIKKIEVLKGPASALYGFNAFDGIINIVTKSPGEMAGTTLQFGGGELGTISSAAIQAGTVGKLGYRLSLGRDQNQQWRNRDALAFRSNKLNAQMEYALPGDAKLSLSGGLVDVNQFDGPIGEVVSERIAPALGYTHLVYEQSALLIRAFWNAYSDTVTSQTNPRLGNLIRITDPSGNAPFPFSGHTYNFDVQHGFALTSQHKLTYGVNYRHNTLSSSVISEFGREDRLGFFLQDEWRPAEPLTVVAGLRYDLNSFINPLISPRIALIYHASPDHTFRVSLSVAYRPPTLFETRQDQQVITTVPTGLPPPAPSTFSTTTAVQGAPNLDPEQIISYEAGYQGWYFNHRVRLRADAFFNHLSDLITSRTVSTTLATFVNDRGYADIYGGEAGMEFLATRWLSGFANLSYQEVNQSFVGTAGRGAPRFKWSAGLRGEWDNGISGEAALFHVGSARYPVAQTFSTLAAVPLTGVITPDSRVDSYNLLNLRGGYKFWKQTAAAGYVRDAEVAVSAFNALNDKHKEHPLGDTIGSRVMGWLTVRF